MHNAEYWKMVKYTFKILQCSHWNILKVLLANFQHYAWKNYDNRGFSFGNMFKVIMKNPGCWWMFRSSHPEVSWEKGALKNFAIFTGKHLWWSLFLIKLWAFSLASANSCLRMFHWTCSKLAMKTPELPQPLLFWCLYC